MKKSFDELAVQGMQKVPNINKNTGKILEKSELN